MCDRERADADDETHTEQLVQGRCHCWRREGNTVKRGTYLLKPAPAGTCRWRHSVRNCIIEEEELTALPLLSIGNTNLMHHSMINVILHCEENISHQTLRTGDSISPLYVTVPRKLPKETSQHGYRTLLYSVTSSVQRATPMDMLQRLRIPFTAILRVGQT